MPKVLAASFTERPSAMSRGGGQGGLIAIGQQKTQLLLKCLTDDRRHVRIVLVRSFRKAELHERRFFSWRLA
jgi:hypothetical protein